MRPLHANHSSVQCQPDWVAKKPVLSRDVGISISRHESGCSWVCYEHTEMPLQELG